jgi:hypothetical protein
VSVRARACERPRARARPAGERRVFVEQSARCFDRAGDHGAVAQGIGEAKRAVCAGLSLAEPLARPAAIEVALSEHEAVRARGDVFEPSAPCFIGRLRDEQARGLLPAATDAAAKLVQLRDAEVLGAQDHDEVGFGNVESDLDDRRAEQDRVRARAKRLEGGALVVGGHLSVQDDDAILCEVL